MAGWIEQAQSPAMIIIDTLGRVKGGTRRGENAYESDTRIFGELQSFALERKMVAVCIHHLKKGTGTNMPTKEQFWDIDEDTGNMGFGGDAPESAETVGYRFHKPVAMVQGVYGADGLAVQGAGGFKRRVYGEKQAIQHVVNHGRNPARRVGSAKQP